MKSRSGIAAGGRKRGPFRERDERATIGRVWSCARECQTLDPDVTGNDHFRGILGWGFVFRPAGLSRENVRRGVAGARGGQAGPDAGGVGVRWEIAESSISTEPPRRFLGHRQMVLGRDLDCKMPSQAKLEIG